MENKGNLCEFFLKHRDNDRYIFYLGGEGGILFCTNQNCHYGNNFGNPLIYEGEKPCVGVCKTAGLKTADVNGEEFKKKLEKVIEDSGILRINLGGLEKVKD